jgi:hypothetical protein
MITEYEIRDGLARYLAGDSDLETFDGWLAQRSWNMHLDSSVEAQELVSAIELALAECSSHHLSLSELRHGFFELLSNGGLVAFGSPQQTRPKTSSRSAVLFDPGPLVLSA